ncbi:DUF4214 domain-containing protein [Oscillatoriales cyanobacterium LEGE 11467]|uniref:DUF4214 domain-containing protein n=1 Tax=Zarconia navalis LEGE 11467 TaxID=1828826 RepID=A0A928VUM5_9CYAN|nr:DUF4214 domain-containing protein [Zarconia navalis]MBE9040542.1 DUF4214 domain-containing protein [Zarconia navalis LEGE 11467]
MNFSKLAISTFVLTLGWTLPGFSQERCYNSEEYSLCFDMDWLRYYNEIDREFDWRNYLEEEDEREPSDYYSDIDRIYRDVLGREADVDGLLHWSVELADGTPLSQVRQEIANSPEAEENIDRIYQEVLGRDVDRSGLETWTRKLARGSTLADIRREIESSEEAAARRS